MTLMRILRFVRRYLGNPVYVLTYGVLYFIPGFRICIHIYTEDEMKTLLQEGKSVIRFGDGEVNLLLGLRNHYQDFSPKLRNMLMEIIHEYKSSSPYILAVPRAITERNDRLKTIERFNVWLPFKTVFLLTFPRKMAYVDAHCFYYNGYIERVLMPVIQDRAVVLVTNSRIIEKQKANLRFPWKNIQYIETPEDDLLGTYHDTVHAINRALEILPENIQPVLLFAAGPVGKHILKHYSERGYQSIDIGRGAEVMFTDESIQSLI